MTSKGRLKDSNTYWAQGGIAAVLDVMHDDTEAHLKDTMTAGAGLCDEAIVRRVESVIVEGQVGIGPHEEAHPTACIDESLQIIGHIVGGLITPPGIFVACLEDNRLQVQWDS